MAEPITAVGSARGAEAAVAQVRQALVGVLGPDANAPAVEDAARAAVAELWDRPVRVFVSVLATRAVRDLLAPAPAPAPAGMAPLALRRTHPDELAVNPKDDLVVDLNDGLAPD